MWADSPCTDSFSVLCERNVTSIILLEQIAEQTKDIPAIKNIIKLVLNLTVDVNESLSMIRRIEETNDIKAVIQQTADLNLAELNETLYELIQLRSSKGKDRPYMGMLMLIALLMCILVILTVGLSTTYVYRSIKCTVRSDDIETELISIHDKS